MHLEPRRPADTGRAAFYFSLLALGVLAAALAAGRAPALVGLAHDDAEYVAYARALAAGAGYVDPTALDPEPARRFPIGFPLLLAPLVARAADGAGAAALAAGSGPLALIAYTVLAGVAIRRWSGLPGWVAGAIAALIVLSPEALYLGSMVLADLPCAVLILGALLLADARLRDPRPARAPWLGIGLLLGAASLIRYAAVAPLLAVLGTTLLAGRRGPAAALAAGAGLLLAPWLAFRSLQGGSRYASEFSTFLGGGDPAATALASGVRLLANGLGGWIVSPAAEADLGLIALLGAVVGLTALYGAWTLRRTAPLPVLALLLTAGLAFVWGLAYVWTERLLMSRLLLPVAPIAFAAFVAGGRALLAADPALAVREAAIGKAGLALGGLATAFALWTGPGVPRAVHAAVARDHAALFTAVRRAVPVNGRIMAPLPALAWLYTDRRAIGYPVGVAGGRDAAAGPQALLARLNDRQVGWIMAAPPLYAHMDAVAESLLPAIAAHPAAFHTVWRSPRGDYALIAVDLGSIAEALAAPEAR